MGLRQAKIQPSPALPSSAEKNPPSNVVVRAYRLLIKCWRQSQIGHQSQYSVERLLAFRDYYQRTSITRAVAVCVLTPIPAISAALLTDCIPLTSPADGVRANVAFWIRMLVDAFVVAMGLTGLLIEVTVEGSISYVGAVVIAIWTSITYTLIYVLVAAAWRFPVPFGMVLSVGPMVFFHAIFTVFVAGPRKLAGSSVLRQQIKTQITIIVTQGVVAIAFPVLSTIFYRLSTVQQSMFAFMTPVVKLIAKQIIANAAKSLHEYVGVIVVCSVDVFNVFFIAVCMQTSKSMVTTLLMIASDGFHVIVALRNIFNQVNVVKTRRGSGNRLSINYLQDLPAMIGRVFNDPHVSKARVGRVRVFAPFPLPLSDDSVAFMDEITNTKRKFHVYYSSRNLLSQQLTTATRSPSIDHRTRKTQLVQLRRRTRERAIVRRSLSNQQIRVGPASPSSKHWLRVRLGVQIAKKLSQRKGSATRRLLTLMDADTAIASATLRAVLSKSAAEEAVWDALQTLFHSEYLLLGEYIECALPALYSAYLAILYHLPVAVYYPQTASTTPEKLQRVVASILLFAAVELASFMALLCILRKKFGISPLYQLAFALETQIRIVQGQLFIWTIFILHMPLAHYGVDFNLPL